jgi:hypothetical protein
MGHRKPSKEKKMAYFVVNHASDENKTDGLVESYQMINVEVEQADGSIIVIPKRLNFVHWPTIPVPFVHEEWSESLAFTNVYVPEDDNNGEEEDDNELNDTIVELLESDYPEVYKILLSEAEQMIEAADEDEEEDEEIEYEDEDQATL